MTIYFVRSGDAIKIGVSGNIPLRIRTLATACQRPVELLAVMPGGYADEKALHDRFAHLRGHGEWFRADTELVDFIAALPPSPVPPPPAPRERARVPDDDNGYVELEYRPGGMTSGDVIQIARNTVARMMSNPAWHFEQESQARVFIAIVQTLAPATRRP